MEKYYPGVDITSNNGPYIHMLIEPETKYRFRYASEGGSHGGLAGKNEKPKEKDKKKKKTYPTVKLSNYNGSNDDIFIKVTLCTEKLSDHVLQFKGKRSSECRSYIDADLDEKCCAVFKDLTILIPKKEDVYQALLKRRIKSHGKNLTTKSAREKFEREHKEDIKKEAKEIFNSVVLKFDAYERARPDVQICPSCYSKPICNQKDSSKGELRICRLSQFTGSSKGGDDIILLCEKVQKDNVRIKFYDDEEIDNGWEAYASFDPSEVHYQVAIPFKTPPYKDNIEKLVKVCLERGDERSAPRVFHYIPEDCPSKKRKRCKGKETLKQTSSSMDGSCTNSSTGVSAVPDSTTENSVLQWTKQSLHEIFQSPCSDSSSSGQQDPDCPSYELGPDFQIDVNIFEELMTYSPEEDAILNKDSVGQNYLMDDLSLQSLDFEMDQFLRPIGMPEGQMAFTEIDAGKIERLRPVGIIEGEMAVTETDAGKMEKLMAVMNLKDPEFDDEIPKNVSKIESKSKILSNEQKKLQRFVPYIEKTDKDGNTLLHLAVLYNKSIKRILQVIKISDSDIINAQNKNKQTALHIAVEKNFAYVKELLQNSANPRIKNAKGNNCCHIACQHDFVECLKNILYPRRCHTSILNDLNNEGLTPLHVALKNNSLSCIDFLLSVQRYYLIDFTAVDSKLGQSFLHYAIEYSPSCVSIFLDEEDIEINCRDFDGNTPLHIACAKGNYEGVRLLMRAGADPGIRNFKHNGSISDEEDSADEALVGQIPADLTTDPNILNLLKSQDDLDVCHSVSNDDKESDRVFEEISKNLSSLLDSDMRWKELAMYVLDEEYVTSLVNCSQNPTRTILDYMKKTSGEHYIEQLKAVLEMVCFIDAVEVINECCKPLVVI